MTQDEMIELAKQAGFFVKDSEAYSPSVQEDHELTPCLEAFAKLVADKEREQLTDAAMKAAEKAVDLAIALEREACAKLLETTDLGGLKDNPAMQSWVADMLLAYVKAIRARGQA